MKLDHPTLYSLNIDDSISSRWMENRHPPYLLNSFAGQRFAAT